MIGIDRIRSKRVHQLIYFFMGVFLLTGLFYLLAPTTVLAAGESITITGDGLKGPGITITQSQLRGEEEISEGVYLEQQDVIYSSINTWPTKSFYRGRGVKVTDLLEVAGELKENATMIRFKGSDGFTATFTLKEFFNEPHYFFPNFMNTGVQGHLPGDTSGAVPVEPIIAHISSSALDLEGVLDDDNLSRSDANHLLFGQRAVTQQTNAKFAKKVNRIEILTDPVQKWDNPTADTAPGEVPAGTLVRLSGPFNDEDKIHYTTDGSDPTIESPMYNWIAKRWWSSRQDDLDEINKPIEITEDTIIKAVVIGPGRADSDIVTFEYTVVNVPVTGVRISQDNQNLEVGKTVQLTAVVEPADASNKSVTWSTDEETVATVSETGLVTAVGEGTATITVTTEDGEFTDSITVTVFMVAPEAAFTADTTSGKAPLTVKFTNNSTGTAPLTYAWDFDNDGTVDSIEKNPTYVYTTAGTYSVKLTVTNEAGSDEEIKIDYITVNPASTPAAISLSPNAGTAGTFVTVTGSGFVPSTSNGVVWFDTNGDGVCNNGEPRANITTVTSDAGGNFSAVVAIPADVAPGNYTIYADLPAGEEIEASAAFTVNAGILLSCNAGIPEATTFITGCGFSPGVAGKIWFDTNNNEALDDGEPSVDVLTDAKGTIPLGTSLTIPSESTGNYTVRADIPDGGNCEAVANFTITGSGIIATPNYGNGRISSSINVTGSGFTPGTSFRVFCDRNRNEIRDDLGYRDGTVTGSGTLSAANLSWPSAPTGIYNFLCDLNKDGTIDASTSIVMIPSIKISTPSGIPETNIGMNLDGFAGYVTGYVWFDTNLNGIWDEGENRAEVTTSASGAATTPGLKVPAVLPGIYQVCAEIPANGLKAVPTPYTVKGITLNPSSGTPGTSISVAGYGLYPNQTIDKGRYIWFDTNDNGTWDDGENKTEITTDASGTMAPISLTIPSVPAGSYKVRISGLEFFADFTLADITPPEAAFTGSPLTGTAPLTVKFTDESTGTEPLTYAWDFDNDGTVDSTEQNPTYEYTEPGTYSVKLTVTNAAGSDEEIKDDYITVSEPSTIDILFDGTVALPADETFTVTAYNSGAEYTVNKNTPLGALHAAANVAGFTYDVTDKNYGNSGALLLDNVKDYNYVKGGSEWYAYVNGIYKDGYNNPAGALNLIELIDDDKVEFYYADTESSDYNVVKAAAIAGVIITVDSDATTPSTWNLLLKGAREETVSKDYFEQAISCGHKVEWTDDEGKVWGGLPLWLLVAMVDDDPDVGSDHINFNDELAEKNYKIDVIAGDGWKATFESADIARNNGYIVANTLNGEPLPMTTDAGKRCWPLHLKGKDVFGGQQVGNIVRIELIDLPEPSAGWTLELLGEIGDTITQEEFEEGLACTGSGHYKEWTDKDGNIWSGVPLWVLLGAVDDIEDANHWTFDDGIAEVGYTIKVIAGDGFYKTFNIADVKRSDDYIIANKCNGEELTGEHAPLRLVGPGVTKDDGSLGGSAVGNIVRIEIPDLQTPDPAPGSWNLKLVGKISDVISQAEFEAGLACPNSGHLVEWTDGEENVWSGIPLWLLAGWVDDRKPHDYDANLANNGYTILVKAGDGYTKDFSSKDVSRSNDYIIANKCNGEPLTDSWPLRLVGDGVAKPDGTLGGTSVGNVAEIELISFETVEIPKLHIVKYGEDGVTVIAERTVDYLFLESEFDVIGDGTKVYKFEGITNNPDDVWDADETYPGGFKIANAVKGTRISDICSLVGGMGSGTEIVFVASDGLEVRLPYSSIYPDPSVYARQGDAILAWWGDGKYVPEYRDGMRLFFMPEDTVYSQWDMHETLPENYWHYYYADGVQYPSCAGLSAKWVTQIKIYSVPQGDWTLELDGQDIGGIKYDVSKTYFEQALTCQFGANHKATYTDDEGQVWEGMPLWFLVGFVDDEDMHSNNAFNNDLALNGYQIVITAKDGHSVTIDSADIIRNSNYIIANSVDGVLLDESGDDWPLKLVGPAVTGSESISQIVSIKLVPIAAEKGKYSIVPEADDAYTIGETQDGIKTMTVKSGVAGFKYFTINITPLTAHSGKETVVFAHFRNGSQLSINATRADFDVVGTAQAGFNVKPGDVIKVYIVDNLTNATDFNPTILQ